MKFIVKETIKISFMYFKLIIILVPLLFLVKPIHAQSALTPIEDAMVSEGNPTDNYGSNDLLVTSDYSQSNIRQAYIKFDLSGISANSITAAKLRLTPALDRNISKTVHIVTNNSWNENTITWNNKPSMGSQIGSINTSTEIGSVVEIDLNTNQVQQALGGILTIGMTNTGTKNTFSVESKENSNPPQLILETSGSDGGNSLIGDANMDGIVDGLDYVVWITNYGKTTSQGPTSGDFNNSGVVDGLDYVVWLSNYGKKASPTPTVTATPTLTATPKPATSTPKATATATSVPSTTAPTSTPTIPPISGSNPYGIYPDCKPPAIGIETHSWWEENGEQHPRHVHLAACMPNARSNNASDSPVLSGKIPVVLRIMAFNSPGYINWVRYSWESNVIEYHRFNPRLRCQTKPNEMKECTWFINMNIDMSRSNRSGHSELRLSPNVEHDDLGTRQFNTNNFQLHKGGTNHYRNRPNPISRAWYTGLDYANVSWTNYLDILNASDPNMQDTMPTVSGVITINVDHAQCNGESNSLGFVDTNFHAVQRGETSFPLKCENVSKVSGPSGCMLYDNSGCWEGSVQFDTRKLTNGVHSIYLQTQENNSDGMNAGAGKYFIRVQN